MGEAFFALYSKSKSLKDYIDSAMARLHSFKIENFRGIKNLSHTFGNGNLFCLIGQGDAGKSTILDAIYFALSPVWNETFNDGDFYECDHSNTIRIETTLTNIPEEFVRDNRFYDYLKSYNPTSHTISDNLDEIVPDGEDREFAISVQLEVTKELEPEWTVICNRHLEGKQISHNDRKKLNVFVVSDSVDRHFQWSKWNPLYYLHSQSVRDKVDGQNIVLEILRDAKKRLDEQGFSQFDETIKRVVELAKKFGMDLPNATSTIDFRDLIVKDGRFSLHDDSIPFRLKGKGSKRLISMAIQTALCKDSGIMLIEEFEQSLESFRVKHAVSMLKEERNAQVFLTTHSTHVLEELGAPSLLRIRKGVPTIQTFSEEYTALLRSNPQAFFHERVIVCEGKTELGVCRALDCWLQENRDTSLSLKRAGTVLGGGSELVVRCQRLVSAEFQTVLFCDSDERVANAAKEDLRGLGVEIVDFEPGESIEAAAFSSLPPQGIKDLLRLARDFRMNEESITEEDASRRIWQTVSEKFGQGCPERFSESDLTLQLRLAIGKASKSNKGWFKTIDRGEQFGRTCLKYYDELTGTSLGNAMTRLIEWLEN